MSGAKGTRVLTSLKATQTGERLDRFELVAEIASGGMATVFLARAAGVAGFQRLFAIKRLHPHLAKEGEFVDMFLDEARLAARIHHPNVVPILEVGTSEQGYYLVMEYIEGDTTARLLARETQQKGSLPPKVAVRVALDTLQGLHAAHDLCDDNGRPLHIVHRDVSPQNILVGIDGVSRITDFGVAHAATRLSSTRTGQLKGKLAYMPPEQAKGAVVDRRADVFAMGVVLWELLVGKRLFKGSNDAETLHRILFAPVPTPRGTGVDIPMPLEAVCMRALEREPADRYASAADFADELERVGRSLDVLATTREIAAYVDGKIGAEISQQREVVRGWLSRSEPSLNRAPPVALPSLSQEPSPRSSSAPLVRPTASSDVTITATPSTSGPLALPSNRRPDVSSVSSAVLSVREDDATKSDGQLRLPELLGAGPEAPSRRAGNARALSAVLGLSALLLAACIGFLIPHPGSGNAAANAPSGAPSAVAAPVEPATPVASATSLAVSPPAASSVRSADAGGESPARRPARPVSPRSVQAPAARPARAAEDPDDLAHNPYR